MSLETLALEHLPETHKVHLAFFRDVQNASFLHEQLLSRNSDFEYAFIDASVVSFCPVAASRITTPIIPKPPMAPKPHP